MIRELSRKEYVERKPLLAIAFTLVLVVTAMMPSLFAFSLAHAFDRAANETAQIVLTNFRSYQVFIESNWCARNLARILCLLALLAGAGAIAGEREARTWPLLSGSSMRLPLVVLVKFGVLTFWLAIVTFASAGVLAAHSLVERLPFPVVDVLVASGVAWANAIAFLGIVFAASALASRTLYAGVGALVAGFAAAAALAPFGLNGTALASNLFASDGSFGTTAALLDVAVSGALAALGLGIALAVVSRRT